MLPAAPRRDLLALPFFLLRHCAACAPILLLLGTSAHHTSVTGHRQRIEEGRLASVAYAEDPG